MGFFFSVRLSSFLCGHSVFPSPPQRPMNSDFEGFSIPDFIHYIFIYFSYLNSSEKASIFTFLCWVPNKNTTGTIFIASLVWRGPWLGIEPGTSRTRSQHSTTRLSRKRYSCQVILLTKRERINIKCSLNGSVLVFAFIKLRTGILTIIHIKQSA